MTPVQRVLFVFALALLTTGGFFGEALLLRQRVERQALEKSIAQLQDEAAERRREHAALTAELAAAEKDLANLQQLASGTDGNDLQRRTEIKAWLVRMKKLKRTFVARPDQNIPEMQLLTDEDWLRVAAAVSLDSETGLRRALAAVRNRAKHTFGSALAGALRKFAKNNNGELPATTLALALYFEGPVDAAMLLRYEMTAKGKAAEASSLGLWVVQERAPVDEDFDRRYYVYSNGGQMNLRPPSAWVPDFRERDLQAAKRFAARNNGVPATSLAQRLPYFDPPLAPALAEKLVRTERDWEME